MTSKEHALNIYTDGSSRPSPRRGGIGVRFVVIDAQGNEENEDLSFFGYRNATNQQMELQACIEALKAARKKSLPRHVTMTVIHSDSRYVVDNYPRALRQWPMNGWFAESGRPIENADLWKELTRQAGKLRMRVEIQWVKGHSKNVHNKAVDKLAKQSAQMPLNAPLAQVSVRRKTSKKSVEIGSVEMTGQRMTIRVITGQPLPIQKLRKYKYEVMPRRSPSHGCVDIIFYEGFLSSGHIYRVRVNEDTKNPRIVKVFGEVTLKTQRK